MPEAFVERFAKRLDGCCGLDVRVAQQGDEMTPGLALISPGNRHMTLCARGSRTTVQLVNGPPVSASFRPDGTATQAAIGFAAKYGVEVSALERTSMPKGEYLAFRKQQRGRAAIDVLPAVLGRTLRKLTFPKLMHWDAVLDDGHGELLFGRPIRWLLFLYGGRVVPFTIGRTVLAVHLAAPWVQPLQYFRADIAQFPTTLRAVARNAGVALCGLRGLTHGPGRGSAPGRPPCWVPAIR